MKEKGPFDAAIKTLKYYHPYKNKLAKESIEAAIKVLEAAGKISRGGVAWVRSVNFNYATARTVVEFLDVLIESLPGPEEERK